MFIITGQTATGKTQLALEYAEKYNGELINFDSRQIYKYLDIVTGKDLTGHQFYLKKTIDNFNIGYYELPVVSSQLSGNQQPTINNQQLTTHIPVWLYDIVKPDQYFSSFDYCNLARAVIEDLASRGKTPIFVGGSYLYLYHLLYQIDTENIPPDFELRKALKDLTVAELQNKLNTISVQSFKRLNQSDKNNPQRLIRKIEIAQYYQNLNQEIPLDFKFKLNQYFTGRSFKIIGLKAASKEMLTQRINQRVEKRLKEGAVNETKKVLGLGYSPQDPGLKTIGYRQIIKFINREIDESTMIKEWVNKEIQYAKRQLTFMKKDKSILWQDR